MQDGPNTIAPGSVTVDNPDSGTNAAVAWLEPNSTAVFAFRGTVTKQDWLKDFQLWCAPHRIAPARTKVPAQDCLRLLLNPALERAMLIITCHLATLFAGSLWQGHCLLPLERNFFAAVNPMLDAQPQESHATRSL